MNRLFSKIGERIEKTPFKVLFLSILIFAIMIAGAIKVNMATGSETLVKTDNDAYISNYSMEESFGGDAIMVLFEGEKENLLQHDNMEKMWNVEQRLKYNDKIFSFMSPASIVHQITDKQSEKIKKQVLAISDGLGEMSDKLTEIGTEFGSKDIKDPKLIEEKLNNLLGITDVFNKLIIGQNNLGEGANQLKGGLSNVSEGLMNVTLQLTEMGSQLEGNPQLQMKLNMIAKNLGESSQGLKTMSEKTAMISEGSQNTSNALSNISSQLQKETNGMKGNLSGGISPDELKIMSSGFITMGENLKKLSEGLKIFYDKSGMMTANFPHNQGELDNILYEKNGELRTIFEDTILDDNHSMMIIKLVGNLEDDAKDKVYSEVSDAMEKEGFKDIDYIVSGKPVLDSSLRTEMQSNMKYMVAFAVVIMFVILNLVFKVRWRVLSLGIIFVSVIATLGLMGHLGVPMTMVSMAVFPILIGLGIDYSIQFQNRYEEEKSVKTTLIQIGKAVGIAVLATVLGFISLYASPVPMIQDFGKMLTIGVIVSFIGSIFLLMPVLNARDTFDGKLAKNNSKDLNKDTLIDKFLGGTVKLVTKFTPIVLIISIVLAAFGMVADSKVGVETDIETFMPQDMDALHDIHYVRDAVGSTDQMVIYMEGEELLSQDNVTWMKDTIENIETRFSNKVIDIKSIDNLVKNFSQDKDLSYVEYIDLIDKIPENQRKMFINESEDKGVILMNIKHMSTEELQKFVKDIQKVLKDAPMDVSVTGKSVLDVEMVKGLTDGRIKMTIIGIGLVFVALLFIYRSFFKALIPIFPIILIVGMSGGVMNLLGLKYTPITATLGALVLGMGTEMTIMLLERYLEERNLGKEKNEAMSITIKRIGKATVASGLTTVGGFSVLMFSKFVILKDFGLMTVINISLALMSTFVILPALIWILDGFIVDKKVKKGAYKEVYQE